jgi:hypothetical protein
MMIQLEFVHCTNEIKYYKNITFQRACVCPLSVKKKKGRSHM